MKMTALVELFTKRKQKADSWVVDDSTIGRSKPSAAADKFIQEQISIKPYI